jgi:hypothetical protein
LKSLKNVLSKPGREYRPWAIWIWNQHIDPDELEKQMRSFAGKGFGGVVIRPGRDMHPAYLSEEFFALFESALAIAKAENIGVRIGDDFALPWGGFFQPYAEQNSALRAQRLALVKTAAVEAKASFEWRADDPAHTLAIAVKVSGDQIAASTAKQIAVSQEQPTITWKSVGADYKILIFKKKYVHDPCGNYIPNMLNPKVAQLYMQHVLERFRTRFSKYAPAQFEGILSEMPAYLPSEEGIPWDDDLVVKYRSKYKKDLIKILPVLFLPVAESKYKIRAHLYAYMAQSMYERFVAVLETWAKKHRLSQWTLAPERDLNGGESVLRDIFAIPAAALGSVGIQNQNGVEENQALIRAMADHNATEFRRETIGIAGRNRLVGGSSLQDLKSEIDLLIANGVQKIIIDGCYFNMDNRTHVRTPVNPSWYYPAWDQATRLCDYAARLGESINGSGMQLARPVAVVYPSSALMAEFLPGAESSVETVRDSLDAITRALDNSNIAYDIISESLFLSCSVRVNGEFGTADRIRKGNYQAVIVPYCGIINKSLFVMLEKMAVRKSMIILVNEAPVGNLDDGVNASFSSRIEKLVTAKSDHVHVVSPAKIPSILKSVERAVKIRCNGKACPGIHSLRGTSNSTELYFLRNASDNQDYYAEIEFSAEKHFYCIDCVTGELQEIESVKTTESASTVSLCFAPMQSYVILASPTKISSAAQKETCECVVNEFGTTARNYRIMLKGQWSFSPGSLNALPLANWTKRIGLSRETGGYAHYDEAYFEVKELPRTCILAMCSRPHSCTPAAAIDSVYEVSVNGNVVEPYRPGGLTAEGEARPEPHWANFCGTSTAKYDIREQITRGYNRISFRTLAAYGDPDALLYPPLVAGEFSIGKGTRGWTIDTPQAQVGYDSWTRHGFPYLSGIGVYSQDFEVPAKFERIILRFSRTSGPVQIILNKQDLGTLSWQPFEVDITKFCDKRRNELIVRVVNTMDNILRMNGRTSGLIGEAYLDIYS